MKAIRLLVVGTSIALASTSSLAQFVKGNEAVRVLPNGDKRVETPPPPSIRLAPPCPADRPGCVGSSWKMVETSEGLAECTEYYARAGTCRKSTYGSQRLSRLWIVKVKSQWLQCQYPDLGSKCVSTNALPFDAVQ